MYENTNFDVLDHAFVPDSFLLYLAPIVETAFSLRDHRRRATALVAAVAGGLRGAGIAFGTISFATLGQFDTIYDDAIVGAV